MNRHWLQHRLAELSIRDIPQIAANRNGEAVAIWSRSSDCGGGGIQWAERLPGGVWSRPGELSPRDSEDREPRISLDAGGTAVAVWTHYEERDFTIRGALRLAGGSWDPVADLSSAGSTSLEPHVAASGAGRATAVWATYEGSSPIIQSAELIAPARWSPPVLVSVIGRDASSPRVALDRVGNAVAVWRGSDGSNHLIHSAFRPAGETSWSLPTVLSAVGENADRPSVSFDSLGNARATWRQFANGRTVLRAATCPRGDSWSPPLRTLPREFG